MISQNIASFVVLGFVCLAFSLLYLSYEIKRNSAILKRRIEKERK